MPNRLAQETSPYLQQHADNPVDWYPWGEEALARSRLEDRPLLVSIGYSACHWCHVMAHESFEDPEVAAVMNRLFVNVKVDREERPDLDRIYQLAHQMLSGRGGGWPLTMFLTPDQVPFYAGTYFPKEPRYGLPGFAHMLERIAAVWREQRADVARQSESLLSAFASLRTEAPADAAEFSAAPLESALASAKSSFDPRHGGFGGAPKFPHPAELQLCLRRFAATGEEEALRVVAYTLERMARGGIYDQLGGGFCRYSVDAEWTIPHFEKMLYDNGPLLALYADAWCATRSPLFERIVRETAAWVMREMQSPQGANSGGYYSSLDADSEHEEGKFYVWSREEFAAQLSDDEYAVASPYYGLDDAPNFEGHRWHLRVKRSLAEVAQALGRPAKDCEPLLESARAKLFAARERRVRPGRDEKILASWNALMIRGMARAGSVFAEPEWIASARRAMDFVRGTLWRDGRLLATSKDGRAHLNAYLDDYAYLLAAAIALLDADFDPRMLAFAQDLARVLLEQFEDRENGGFFFTSHDHERLIHRDKPGQDNATPSGNGMAAFALNRLTYLTGDTRYASAAARTLSLFYSAIRVQAGAFSTLLAALEESLAPTRTVVLRGANPELSRWRDALAQQYMPQTMVIAIDAGQHGLPEALAKPVSASTTAWICEGATCLAPIADLEELRAKLLVERR
ncbi:MAG: thioredoxin domain-containing protein [Betaproteobacteria bacterium]|nr:thioredoxin domain-containing protein [Betaproteobacteria bacterium]